MRSPEFDRSRRRALLAAVLLAGFPLIGQAAPAGEDIQVDVSRRDEVVIVHARLTVPVPAKQAFSVMTDYDHMTAFLPDLKESRIVERSSDRLLVAQSGGVRIGPVSIPFDYVRRVELTPVTRLVSHVVSGSIKQADVTTTLTETGGKTLIAYDSEAIMGIWLPFGISTSLIAGHIRHQLDSMRIEMLRRQASGGSIKPAP